MCLYTRDKKPRVAKRDIVCRKYLRERDGKYQSPNQGTPVTLNEVMIAKPDKPQISHYDRDKWGNEIMSLNGGAIHAKLFDTNNDYGNVCKKAIIPAGTKYWLDTFGREIAAERMLITDEDAPELNKDFAADFIKDAPEENGIYVGDYYLTNDSYARPSENINKDEVIGQVVGFHDGKPLIASIEIFIGRWDERYDSKIGNSYSSSDDAIKDFGGKDTTAKYKAMPREDRFEAFNLCLDYRNDREEEWYFPAMGEMTTMLNNALYINTARIVSGIGEVIPSVWFWTCSEGSYRGSSWGCSLYDVQVYCDWYYKYGRCSFVPFFASKAST